MHGSMHVSAWVDLEDGTPIQFVRSENGEVEFTFGRRDGLTITASPEVVARLAAAATAALRGDR